MRWLWPGRISLGGITVLDSVFDREKRLLAFDLAARVSTGRPMPDGLSKPEAPGHVVLLIHRLLSHTVRTCLEAAGADLSHVTHRSCEVDDLLPGAARKAMSRSIPEGTKLVVIDPLVCPAVTSFPVPKGGGAARAALVRLADLAEQTGAATLLLRDLHVGSDPDPRSSDSSVLEILGVARTRLIVVRNGDDKHGMVLASTPPDLGGGVGPQPYSLAPDDQHVPTIVWGGPGKLRTTVPPERADGGAAPASKVDVAGQLLLKWLAAEPLPAKVVMQRAAAAGITEPIPPSQKSQEIPYLLRRSKVRAGPKGSENGWQNPKRLAVRLAEIGWRRSCRSASPECCQPAKPGTGIARRTHTVRSTTLSSRHRAQACRRNSVIPSRIRSPPVCTSSGTSARAWRRYCESCCAANSASSRAQRHAERPSFALPARGTVAAGGGQSKGQTEIDPPQAPDVGPHTPAGR